MTSRQEALERLQSLSLLEATLDERIDELEREVTLNEKKYVILQALGKTDDCLQPIKNELEKGRQLIRSLQPLLQQLFDERQVQMARQNLYHHKRPTNAREEMTLSTSDKPLYRCQQLNHRFTNNFGESSPLDCTQRSTLFRTPHIFRRHSQFIKCSDSKVCDKPPTTDSCFTNPYSPHHVSEMPNSPEQFDAIMWNTTEQRDLTMPITSDLNEVTLHSTSHQCDIPEQQESTPGCEICTCLLKSPNSPGHCCPYEEGTTETGLFGATGCDIHGNAYRNNQSVYSPASDRPQQSDTSKTFPDTQDTIPDLNHILEDITFSDISDVEVSDLFPDATEMFSDITEILPDFTDIFSDTTETFPNITEMFSDFSDSIEGAIPTPSDIHQAFPGASDGQVQTIEIPSAYKCDIKPTVCLAAVERSQ